MALFCAHCCFSVLFPRGDSVLTSFLGDLLTYSANSTLAVTPSSQRLQGSFVLLLFALPWSSLSTSLWRFMEPLIFSILASGRKVYVSYFISFAMDLHVYFNRFTEQSYQIFDKSDNCSGTSSVSPQAAYSETLQQKPSGRDPALQIHSARVCADAFFFFFFWFF